MPASRRIFLHNEAAQGLSRRIVHFTRERAAPGFYKFSKGGATDKNSRFAIRDRQTFPKAPAWDQSVEDPYQFVFASSFASFVSSFRLNVTRDSNHDSFVPK